MTNILYILRLIEMVSSVSCRPSLTSSSLVKQMRCMISALTWSQTTPPHTFTRGEQVPFSYCATTRTWTSYYKIDVQNNKSFSYLLLKMTNNPVIISKKYIVHLLFIKTAHLQFIAINRSFRYYGSFNQCSVLVTSGCCSFSGNRTWTLAWSSSARPSRSTTSVTSPTRPWEPLRSKGQNTPPSSPLLPAYPSN